MKEKQRNKPNSYGKLMKRMLIYMGIGGVCGFFVGIFISFGFSARKSAPLITAMGDSVSGLPSFAPLVSPAIKKHRIYRCAPHDLCRKIFR